jgi:hypothetical protein
MINDKAIGDAITSIARGFDEELYALSEDELKAQWYFKWDDALSVAANMYQFTSMLDSLKGRARRWETHHHGSMCVVERVRDKYLMPRINEFLRDLFGRIAWPR